MNVKKRRKKTTDDSIVLALAGNPNVGKSTVFNALTGLRQHTGNWSGKTVSNATGSFEYHDKSYLMYDLPGTYSLIAHSKEEEVARDFICFGKYDAIIVVCDAVCLERNLNLVLQILEITDRVIICLNLLDEAKKKKIKINLEKLSELLGVPVVGTSARSKKGFPLLLEEMERMCVSKIRKDLFCVKYEERIEHAIVKLVSYLEGKTKRIQPRFVALRLLENDSTLYEVMMNYLDFDEKQNKKLQELVNEVKEKLKAEGIYDFIYKDLIVKRIVVEAEHLAHSVTKYEKSDYRSSDRKWDLLLTNKWTGIPIMLFMLMIIFWITINGANYPSQILFDCLFGLEPYFESFFEWLKTPDWVYGILVMGMYRTLAWVVAVMLPPMAIFFPLFTILEDLGVLPRIAFNLDKYFKKCCACGKQALTMCMGFGCNAAGVTGCRIIDSPRERLIAIVTNSFVPCNGRFPTIIAIISMFFVGFQAGIGGSVLSVVILTGIILLGIGMTFIISKLLSKTVLKGVPSSFTLELPPYRRPKIGSVVVHSIFDRTLFVLGRAVSIAAPAGIVIWLLANITIGDSSLLWHCTSFLDPFARLIGLDGVILMAFILGFPANEIVIPIMIMAYMATGYITDFSNLTELKTLLVDHGWTWLTAVCVMLFSLMHWPCSTTCLTIKKETGSMKWMFLSILIPTVTGIVICFLITTFVRLFGFV